METPKAYSLNPKSHVIETTILLGIIPGLQHGVIPSVGHLRFQGLGLILPRMITQRTH